MGEEFKEVIDAALKPAAEEFAENAKGSGASLGRAVRNVAGGIELLSKSVGALVWSFDQIRDRIKPALDKRLKNVPEENRIQPDPMIAVPALEALRYTGHKDELREMFVNLLGTSMDDRIAATAHPAFVEVLKQLTPDEAKILRYMSKSADIPVIDIQRKRKGKPGYNRISSNVSQLGELASCDVLILVQGAIDNLCRLSLCIIPEGSYLVGEGVYDDLQNSEFAQIVVSQIEQEEGATAEFDKKLLTLTTFGKLFIDACVRDD